MVWIVAVVWIGLEHRLAVLVACLVRLLLSGWTHCYDLWVVGLLVEFVFCLGLIVGFGCCGVCCCGFGLFVVSGLVIWSLIVIDCLVLDAGCCCVVVADLW